MTRLAMRAAKQSPVPPLENTGVEPSLVVISPEGETTTMGSPLATMWQEYCDESCVRRATFWLKSVGRVCSNKISNSLELGVMMACGGISYALIT